MIDKKDLLLYEASSITEYISWEWLQDIVARLLAMKINRKWKRYEFRVKRDRFFKQFNSKQGD